MIICGIFLSSNYRRNYLVYFCFLLDPCIIYHITFINTPSLIPIYTLLVINGIDKNYENYK